MDAIVQTTRRYCQGRQAGAEYYNDCENFQAYPVFGGTIDEVLVMGFKLSSSWFNLYYGHDHLYSPVVFYGPSGVVLERYEYDAYGKVQIMAPDFSSRIKSLYDNPYTFTGRELDSLDNNTLHLMYYRARSYDPQTGRFMQRDPFGVNPAGSFRNPFHVHKQYHDSSNIYEYVTSNSMNSKDAFGLYSNPGGWFPPPGTFPPVSDPGSRPLPNKDNTACCKINVGVMAFGKKIGSACTQVSINSNGFAPNFACKCRFKNQNNTQVYSAHAGECCWCTVSLKTAPFPILGHYFIQIDCDGKQSWISDTYPQNDDSMTPYPATGDKMGYPEWSWRTLSSFKTSCDNADSFKSVLERDVWDWSGTICTGDGNCFQYALPMFLSLSNMCP